ncbi:MAG: 4-hydroxy-3-methylbut-2-enyl diphosphate reductase [Clostridia bacterium]|nr:4-hydroxy-3-methylbut-2-enyl diphosphate reductase [Clostridia bacterium]
MARPEIIVAKHAGFCFGVKRATEKLELALKIRPEVARICTLGHLIHNDVYNESLRARGVENITREELATVAASASKDCHVTVFVRAHGIVKEVAEELERYAKEYEYFWYFDCTCPFVSKIHRIAEQESDENSIFLLLGDEKHPEVEGIMSYAAGEKYVFPDFEGLKRLVDDGILQENSGKTLKFVAQTTQKLSEWRKCEEYLKNLFTNLKIFDTICIVTEERQTEAASLAQECDFMIVIGGRQSSNTRKLYAVCRSACDAAVQVDTAEDLLSQDLIPLSYKKVGIVAGASTPQTLIQEVCKTMSEAEIRDEDFSTMLEDSIKTINTGDTVKGVVTAVTDLEIQLDLGVKVTGVIKSDDDPTVKYSETYKVGDEIEAFVVRVNDVEGVATLSKKRIDSDRSWKIIEDAKEERTVLTAVVSEAVKGGVVIRVSGHRIFVPASQTGVPKGGDFSTLVGTEVSFRIIEVKPGKKAIGSIRSVLAEERAAKEAEFWANIEEGKSYVGVVKSMTSYGAFVDLGGVDGMVHKSELSWRDIPSPAAVVSIGDELRVFVKSFDAEKKRISLGYKTEETNPWYIFTHNYQVGDVVPVKVVNIKPFGAFAEIVDGVDGLIHISQISTQRIEKPEDVLALGDVVDAKIIGVETEGKDRRISLSIKAVLQEVAESAEATEAAEETAEETAEDAE